MVGPTTNLKKGLPQCSIRSLPSARPRPCSPARSSLLCCSFRPRPRSRSPDPPAHKEHPHERTFPGQPVRCQSHGRRRRSGRLHRGRPAGDPARAGRAAPCHRAGGHPFLPARGLARARRPERWRGSSCRDRGGPKETRDAQAAVRPHRFCITVPAQAALPVGAKAPDFVTNGAVGGKPFKLHLQSELRKGPVVLYFFPKAFTRAARSRRMHSATRSATLKRPAHT